MACRQRAKFEGWLKFELAISLSRQAAFQNITLEDGYPSKGRSDISFVSYGVKWFIEMKTANTNFRADGLENKGRPVTRNMAGIVEDFEVLQKRAKPARGLAVFCIFPVPSRLWGSTIHQLTYHLDHIEHGAGLQPGSLRQDCDYVEVNPEYGICTYVVEVE
jgi:hypothetical protein